MGLDSVFLFSLLQNQFHPAWAPPPKRADKHTPITSLPPFPVEPWGGLRARLVEKLRTQAGVINIEEEGFRCGLEQLQWFECHTISPQVY